MTLSSGAYGATVLQQRLYFAAVHPAAKVGTCIPKRIMCRYEFTESGQDCPQTGRTELPGRPALKRLPGGPGAPILALWQRRCSLVR